MREYGIPQVVTWRWTPFAALVLGALSFVGFTLLVIPDHIGQVDAQTTADRFSLGNHFVRTPVGSTPAGDWSKDNADPGTAAPGPVTRVATQGAEVFPKRGFSPPLDRAEQPPAQPSQPVLAVPPPEPPPPVPPPPAPEVMPQPVPAPQAGPLPPDPVGAAPAPPPIAPNN